MALCPAGEVPQYHFYYKIGRRVGLRLILALLKLSLALIRLGRMLKPSRRLCPFLLGIFKLRVGLWLISLNLYILWLRRRRKGGGGGRGKGGRRGGRNGKGIKGGKGGQREGQGER